MTIKTKAARVNVGLLSLLVILVGLWLEFEIISSYKIATHLSEFLIGRWVVDGPSIDF